MTSIAERDQIRPSETFFFPHSRWTPPRPSRALGANLAGSSTTELVVSRFRGWLVCGCILRSRIPSGPFRQPRSRVRNRCWIRQEEGTATGQGASPSIFSCREGSSVMFDLLLVSFIDVATLRGALDATRASTTRPLRPPRPVLTLLHREALRLVVGRFSDWVVLKAAERRLEVAQAVCCKGWSPRCVSISDVSTRRWRRDAVGSVHVHFMSAFEVTRRANINIFRHR